MPYLDEGRTRRKALNKILYAQAVAAEEVSGSAPQVQQAAPVAQAVETAYAEPAQQQQAAAPAQQQEAAPAPAVAATATAIATATETTRT